MVQVWSSYDVAIQKANMLNRIVETIGYIPEELKKAIQQEIKVAYKSCITQFYEHLKSETIQALK